MQSDYIMMPIGAMTVAPTPAPAAPCTMPTTVHREIAPFLRNLRRMLDMESDQILRWMPEGNAFEIYDIDALAQVILPKYFKHNKYSSFQRQLNYFHFRKWSRARTAVCTFSNPYFLRDKPQLTWRIRRKRVLNNVKVVYAAPPQAAAAAAQLPVSPSSSADCSVPMPIKTPMPSSTTPYSPCSPSEAACIQVLEPLPAFEPLEPMDTLDWVDTLFPSLEMLTTLGEADIVV